jgi:hypothetical protein
MGTYLDHIIRLPGINLTDFMDVGKVLYSLFKMIKIFKYLSGLKMMKDFNTQIVNLLLSVVVVKGMLILNINIILHLFIIICRSGSAIFIGNYFK